MSSSFSLPRMSILYFRDVHPVTVNGGMRSTSWYDIDAATLAGNGDDVKGLERSMSQIMQLVEAERGSGISSERIILGGFSQGGVVSLYTGLRNKLGAIFALSSYLPQHKQTIFTYKPDLFMAHGKIDNVISYVFGEASMQFLKENGCRVTWKSYNFGHSVSDEELHEMGVFLKSKLQ